MQSSFTDNIWGPDIAEMQLISKYYKDFVIDIYNKYIWVIPLKGQKWN